MDENRIIMMYLKQIAGMSIIVLTLVFAGCKQSNKPKDKDLVNRKEKISEHTKVNIQQLLTYAEEEDGRINDSVKLNTLELIRSVYEGNEFQTVWSDEGNWRAIADSLYWMIYHAKEYGLFPADYNYTSLVSIKSKLQADSLSRRDAALWSRADILLSDAYFNIARHLKLGRLESDSISLRNDSLLNDAFFYNHFTRSVKSNNILASLHALEPVYPEYRKIKKAIPAFLDSADFRSYTYLPYPYKDSVAFLKLLRQRLSEEGLMMTNDGDVDTTELAEAIRMYQQQSNVKPSGKISESVIRSLNNTDTEKFISIAITLDRYKLLPETPPETYVLVNLPSFTLYVYKEDTMMLTSKTIVGTWKTKTPLLNSKISNFITYPQWTVPYSIIFKEMLPKIQKDVSYLDKQNLMVVDRYDSVIDPRDIDWASLNSKKFPYLLRQRQGDDNSLGVIKFNFVNRYSVYLHDTNTRNLFNRSARALSHGCVRVQDWEGLYQFLIRSDTARFRQDTINAWFERQEKHTVTGFPKVPLYIRYFTVEGKKDQLKFYSDIYGYDRISREKYFATKKII